MHALAEEAYERVRPLIAQSAMRGCRAKPCSVIDGLQPGAVFVDNGDRPQTALICGHRLGAYYAFGDPYQPAFLRFVPELLERHLTERYCALFATSHDWETRLSSLFDAPYARLAFDFAPPPGWPPSDWRQSLPPGFTLARLDAALTEGMGERVGSFLSGRWGSIEGFLKHGFGFCITRGGQVVSYCMTSMVGGGEAEIQIQTFDPELQRRGLATLAATAFIEHCLGNGLKPGWTTDLENHASVGLAKRLVVRHV
jgi:ribosomal protein S18 acetylase RimI-like enzyme